MNFRPLIKRLIGDYNLWHIYTISTTDCVSRSAPLVVTPIDAAEFFSRDLEPDLKKADWGVPGAYGFVVWDKEEPVGVCWYWPGEATADRNAGPLPNDEAELIEIVIGTRSRGKGVGQFLVAETALRMRAAGYRRLYAQIWHSNKPSKRAFRAVGWSEVGIVYRIAPPWSARPLEFRWRTTQMPGVLDHWGSRCRLGPAAVAGQS